MLLSELQTLDQEYLAHTYKRQSLAVECGSGAVASDADGRAYVDFSSGIGVNSLGFVHPAWAQAVKAQIDQLAHISNLYYTQPMISLAQRLCQRTGMARVFFGNSGAEANEGAIKTARKYGSDHYGAQRCEIVCLENSFHGRTITTLAATGQENYHKNFGPFPAGFVFAKAGDIEDLHAKVNENTCAIMIECIQGEGGVVPLDPAYTTAIAALCAEKDILLIVDEVQTGVGRTGKFLCAEHYNLHPDIVTLAKGLGGGLPIGAVLFGDKVKDTLSPGDHGSTFGGNPIVCAGALAVLDTLEDTLLDEVAEKGAYIAKQVAAMPGVTGVTGKGMMLGISLKGPYTAGDVAAACIPEGLIVLTAKDKVRFLPPLTITYEEIDRGLAVFSKVLTALEEGSK